MRIVIRPTHLTRVLVTIVCCLVLAHVITEVLRMGFGVERFAKLLRFVDLGSEGNLPTWYSSAALLLASALLAVIALHKRRAGAPYERHWAVLALIFLGLSIDEAAQIHEMTIKQLRALVGGHGLLHFTWVIPGAAFTITTALAYMRFLKDLPPGTRLGFLAGGAMFVGGALGAEMIGGYLLETYGRHSVAYAVVKTVEETLEMLGIVVFIHALTSYIADDIGAVRVQLGAARRGSRPVRADRLPESVPPE